MSRTASCTLALAAAILGFAPGVGSATTHTETAAQLLVPLHLSVYEPCRGETVELKGALSFQGSIMISQEGATELQYALRETDVHGVGIKTGTRYDFVGDSHGVTDRLDRLVTEDDFRVIARQEPGVEVGRASVEPRYTATLEVTFSERGAIEAVVAKAVVTDMVCL